MFFMLKKKKNILLVFQNITQNSEKQVILLMFGEGWHYLAVKKLSAL